MKIFISSSKIFLKKFLPIALAILLAAKTAKAEDMLERKFLLSLRITSEMR